MNDSHFEQPYSRDDALFGMIPTRELLAMLDARMPEGHVLELGCGDGRDTVALLRRGYRVIAIDDSSTAVQKLRSRVVNRPELASRLDARCADVRAWGWDVVEVDCVAAVTLFDHLNVDDGRAVLKRALSRLRSGGLLFAQVMTTDDPAVSGRGPASEFADVIRHYFEPNELLRWVLDDVRVVWYEERMEWDNDHGPAHMHGMALVAGIKR